MYKSLMVLLLCLAFSGAFCYAHGEARTENMKVEGAILIIKTAQHGGTDKSGSIAGFKWSFNGPK